MKWYRHGYKNACELVPVPEFPSTRTYQMAACFTSLARDKTASPK